MRIGNARGHAPWYLRFHNLMPHRVREVLLVSSPYDAFILEEDGQLSARIFVEYSNLDLSQAPRITHATSVERAMVLLAERHFDMVITMVRMGNTDVAEFARRIKAAHGRIPVVVFAFSEAELVYFSEEVDCEHIDRIFIWTGDTRILVAAIKLVEDAMNVDYDIRSAGVRVIIVVEDSVGRYSSFLSLFYGELLQQASSLIAEGLNDLHKRLRMRARPRILLATTFEEAIEYYRKYQRYVFALITDVRFPREGHEDPEAGFDLVRIIHADDPDLPILMQSAEPALAERAAAMGVSYAQKNSPHLARQIRDFLKEGLGFGDFIFRLPDRTEVGRVSDVYEMERALSHIPVESIEYHALRNHFSLWLMARSMLRLAERLRPRRVDEFANIEDMRRHLVAVLREARMQERQGAITDFSPQQDERETPFVRLGKGSIGGKGRGIAFVNAVIVRHGLAERFDGLRICIPRTVAIGTDEFDRFVETNRLEDLRNAGDDNALRERFVAGRLSEDLLRDLKMACLWEMRGPLAVRSSSLLEDSQLHPFAGIYSTYMIPNNHPDPSVRLRELCRAIKAVYASTYGSLARSYSSQSFPIDDEKMGVVIQEIVGQRYDTRHYPHFSGVALSHNYYPFGAQRAEDGVVALALGLGQTVVSGGNMLQFSPATPQVLPQFPSPQHYLEFSQKQFYAVDLSCNTIDLSEDDGAIQRHELKVAEADGTLAAVGSVYSVADDTIRDGLREKGPRLVTFNNILKWETIPLAAALTELMHVMREAMGQPVEIEFAVDMGDWGRPDGKTAPALYVLQVRPQSTRTGSSVVIPSGLPDSYLLCRASMSLGHGVIDDIEDVVFVKPEITRSIPTPRIAKDVGLFNAELAAQKRPYVLIGPGRWGSSDPFLGVPVQWNQIAGARVIIETPLAGRSVEPSQGSHFFHNIISRSVGYLTLHKIPGADGPPPLYDHAWLEQQHIVRQSDAVCHVRLDGPLAVYIDGQRGEGAIFKPGTPSPAEIDDPLVLEAAVLSGE